MMDRVHQFSPRYSEIRMRRQLLDDVCGWLGVVDVGVVVVVEVGVVVGVEFVVVVGV